MMRSLFSGISGLKVHQTKMDVIGNNISNVNTVGFRASTVNFTDVFYQTTQSAAGPSEETNAAGTNAMQIGLGANVAAIAVDLSGTGATQRTDRGMDLMINGDAFFIAQNTNGQTCFTKSGALDIDANGTLYCTTNGAKILGWRAVANPATGEQEIRKDTATTLDLMSGENSYSDPRATSNVTLTGNIDNNDPQVQVDGVGYVVSPPFYDRLGALYSAKLSIQLAEMKDGEGNPINNTSVYTVKVTDVMGPDGKSALVRKKTDAEMDASDDKTEKYVLTELAGTLNFNGYNLKVNIVDQETGAIEITADATEGANDGWPTLTFKSGDGTFDEVSRRVKGPENPDTYIVDPDNNRMLNLTLTNMTDAGALMENTTPPQTTENAFPTTGVEIDFGTLTMFATSGASKVKPNRGDYQEGYGAGNPAGTMNGFSVQPNGMIYGMYSNGDSKLLGQIAVATFPNPSGLESLGNSLYAATQNSGDFDGIGIDITEVGKFSIGALEMSDVDLSTEFTNMITTQRGFQANSRIITTSDTMLEELVNLKR